MTDFLFAMPSFLSGFASAIDLGGTLHHPNVLRSTEEADLMALRSDWIAIGKDIRGAAQALTSNDGE